MTKTKTTFSVLGAFKVPYHQGKAGRSITDENIKEFWKKTPAIAKARGCYVFGVRAAKGSTPGYVGKASKSFKQEVFGFHKIVRYQQFLTDYLKGTPILFFLVAGTKTGTPNKSHIKELEDYLIQIGVAANPDLLNIKGTKVEEWGIAGILRASKGKPSKAARDFKRLMKLGKI